MGWRPADCFPGEQRFPGAELHGRQDVHLAAACGGEARMPAQPFVHYPFRLAHLDCFALQVSTAIIFALGVPNVKNAHVSTVRGCAPRS